MSQVAGARSLLFVPGHRPDRFDKALGSGADGVVIDLEDAVAPEQKDAARLNLLAWSAAGGSGIVRVNAAGTTWHEDDLEAVAATGSALMLPKATLGSIRAVVAALPAGTPVVALVETAAGIIDAPALARHVGVVRLAFGNVDLGAELGVDPDDPTALLSARSALVLASAAAGITPPVDGVCTEVADRAALTTQVRHAASLGFTGKLCIHPRQVGPVHEAFAPDAEQVEHAWRVVRAAGDGAVTVLDGRMLDRPVVERARQIVRRAGVDRV